MFFEALKHSSIAICRYNGRGMSGSKAFLSKIREMKYIKYEKHEFLDLNIMFQTKTKDSIPIAERNRPTRFYPPFLLPLT